MRSRKKALYINCGIYVVLCMTFGLINFFSSGAAQSDQTLQKDLKSSGDNNEKKEIKKQENEPPLDKEVLSISRTNPKRNESVADNKKIDLIEDKESETINDSDYVSVKDVEAALAASKAKSPQICQDALRVWKNYKSGKSDPHYSYRFWARNLVLWLRADRNLTFENQNKVGAVFKVLLDKGMISPDAAVLLTTDVWNYFIFREGVPDLETQLPKYEENKRARQNALDSNRDIAT